MFRSVAVAQALAQKRLSKVSVTKAAYECCVEKYLEVSVERSVTMSLKTCLQLDNIARVDEKRIPKAIFCIRVRGFYQFFEKSF